ncbi:MAG: xanthine dehydrogenase family protein subunit M [Desulfobacterales bacterium]|nr:xanthine dehydrogenase family protein subunit M [Desulfobacterales bacterium]
MLLPKFDFHAPVSLQEASEILAAHGDRAKVIAGGTDLMVNLKRKVVCPEHLVSLARIESLKTLTGENGSVRIGAYVTVDELAVSETVCGTIGALAAGARALGTPLIRNRATIGGNLGSARPAADLPPSLMAYGASVVLMGSETERTVLLDDFFKGPGLTVVKPGECITEIRVPKPPEGAGAGYINLGVRKSQDCNIVNVASYLALNGDGSIAEARVVMGSVGPTPLHATSAEALLKGEFPDEALFARAGEAAAGDSTPILDFRGSAQYRRDMVAVLARRTLALALKEAHSS